MFSKLLRLRKWGARAGSPGLAAHPVWVLAAVAAVYTIGVLGAGFVAGNWASDHNLKTAIVEAYQGTALGRKLSYSRRQREASEQLVQWRLLPNQPNLHRLEYAVVKLAPFDTYGEGGAIEEIDGAIVFASPVGQLGYLGRDNVMRPLPLLVPMNFDRMLKEPVFNDPRFSRSFFRVLDLLAVDVGGGDYDFYVSHHQLEDGCIQVVVSRARLHSDENGLSVVSQDWDQIFAARPCMPLIPDWQGLESGGRMVLHGDGLMLLSIGDHEMNGVGQPLNTPQDLDYDLGKIIEINLRTGASRPYAIGVRNPQGLMVARDGTVWETEHGPQGGDEINIIRDGGNYGWPVVTYGTRYGGPPGPDWPHNPAQGRHDGYTKPIYAFVPSIGISNLVEPDLREFPRWRDDLLVASLTATSLFIVRVEDDERVAYVEPILFPDERLRDILRLKDGRIVMLTYNLELIFLRNADRTPEATPDRVSSDETEFTVVTGPEVEGARMNLAGPDTPAERGRAAFNTRCATCHSLHGEILPGPPLDGVMGRRMGSVEGFGYSPALAGRDDVWTDRALERFLTNPGSGFGGTVMPRQDVSRDEARQIAAFLDGL